MNRNDTESVFFWAAGPIGAILLGMLLVPFRGYTSASNLTFVFMALTILIAEFGGRWAAIATALCSALSLDFFLTQPYLRLTIADKHDVIAFAGLAACGLLAATFGSRRAARRAELRMNRKMLDLYHDAVRSFEASEPVDSRLSKLLVTLRETCPISAAAIRDDRNTIVAGVGPEKDLSIAPVQILSSQTLLLQGRESESRNRPLPADGGSVPLMSGNRRLGSLDLWGDGRPVSEQGRRLLADAASILAIQLASSARQLR